ncbi:MAG: S8 family serine peptidase [archaeon]
MTKKRWVMIKKRVVAPVAVLFLLSAFLLTSSFAQIGPLANTSFCGDGACNPDETVSGCFPDCKTGDGCSSCDTICQAETEQSGLNAQNMITGMATRVSAANQVSGASAPRKSYIIQFRDPPASEKNLELERDIKNKRANLNGRGNFYRQTVGRLEGRYIDLQEEGIPSAILEYRDDIRERHRVIPDIEKKIMREYTDAFNGFSAELTDHELQDLMQSGEIEAVYPDAEVNITLSESVPLIGADYAWSLGYTGKNVTIGIIDTGVDYMHPDLGGCFGYNGTGPSCGDGTCSGEETCSTCEADCGTCVPFCGDGSCNGAETCNTCTTDCGACPSCGDGICSGDESCTTCEADCGACSDCYDSDGGIDVMVKGYATLDGTDLHWDFCQGPSSHTEYYCKDNEIMEIYNYCGFGCADGACNPSDNPTCYDSDGGKNIFVKGYATDRRGYNLSDYCHDALSFEEAYCSPATDYAFYSTQICPEGSECADGRCTGGETCGDGLCNENETCGTCPGDCGECGGSGADTQAAATSGPCKVIDGYDFVNGDDDPMDDHGHGTHVAATAAGDGLFKGVAPDAKIVAYKVLSASGSGYTSWVMGGIERSLDPNQDGDYSDHLDVISLSLGGSGHPDDALSLAIDNVVSHGVVAVVAAGNNGPYEQTISSPGTARNAITVGASDKSDVIAGFSSRGPVIWSGGEINKPDILAPGVSICAAQHNGWYDAYHCYDDEHISIQGTSMATPHVSGVVALMLQKNPGLLPDEVKQILMETAVDLGYAENVQGAGRIDAATAILQDQVSLIGRISTYGDVDGITDIYGTASGELFQQYTLEIGSGTDPTQWELLAQSGNPIRSGVMHTMDTSLRADGIYALRLTVYPTDGNPIQKKETIEINNVYISSPADESEVPDLYGELDILGRAAGANFDRYVVEYGQGKSPDTWFTDGISLANDGLEPIVDDILATIDIPTMIANTGVGYKTIRITMFSGDVVSGHSVYVTAILHQEGWPKQANMDIRGAPTIADIDADGDMELLVGFSDRKVYAFHHTGEIVAGWPPGTTGVIDSTPAVADIDDDGYLEVFAGSRDGKMYGWHHDGTQIGGWPQDTWYTLRSSAKVDSIWGWCNFGPCSNGICVDPAGSVGNCTDADGNNKFVRGVAYDPITTIADDCNGTSVVEGLCHRDGYAISRQDPCYYGCSNGACIIPEPEESKYGCVDDDGGKNVYQRGTTYIPGEASYEDYCHNAEYVLEYYCSTKEMSGDYVGSIKDSPTIGDVDGDGDLEIAAGVAEVQAITDPTGQGNQVYLWHHDGTLVDGWPVTIYYSGENPNGVYGTPTLIDLDDDGDLEIVAASESSSLQIWHHDGTPFEGDWPKIFSGYAFNMDYQPTIADIDLDGSLDILVTRAVVTDPVDWTDSHMTYIYAYRADGSSLPGFPITMTENYTVHSSPVVGNLDDDPELEIALPIDYSYRNNTKLTITSYMQVRNHDGTVAWQREVPRYLPWWGYYARDTPTIADADGDGDPEILIGISQIDLSWYWTGGIMGWHHDGTPLEGYPLNVGAVESGITIQDLDLDGDAELAVAAFYGYALSSSTGKIIVIDLPGADMGKENEWRTYHHDIRRTGNYHAEPVTGPAEKTKYRYYDLTDDDCTASISASSSGNTTLYARWVPNVCDDYWDEAATAPGNQTAILSRSGLSHGSYALKVEYYGNYGLSVQTECLTDITAPAVVVQELPQTVNGSELLQATVTDAFGLSDMCEVCMATETCNWIPAVADLAVGDKTGACRYMWNASSYPDGDYNVNFRAWDVNGNIGYGEAKTARIELNPPRFEYLIADNHTTTNSPVYFEARVSDVFGVGEVGVDFNGYRTIDDNGSGIYRDYLTAPSEPGEYTLRALAYDLSGNLKIAEKSVRVDERITWSKDIRLTPQASRPEVYVDGPNTHIVWTGTIDGNPEIYYSKLFNGKLQIHNQRISNNIYNSLNPSVAADQYGNAYVAWQDDRDGNKEIYVSRNGAVQRLTFNDADSTDPVLFYGNGDFILSWLDDRSGKGALYLKIFDAGGNIKADDTKLTPANHDVAEFDASFGDALYFTYTTTSGDLLLGKYSGGGAETREAGSGAVSPRIDAAGSRIGAAVIENGILWYRMYNPDFELITEIAVSAEEPSDPSLALDAGAAANIMWIDAGQLKYAKILNDTFLVLPAAVTQNATSPADARIATGSLHFVYSDQSDLFYKTSEEEQIPPLISNVRTAETGAFHAQIEWATDEPSTSTVRYGKTGPLSIVSSDDLVTEHRVVIEDLDPGSLYYYVAASTDIYGNVATDDNHGLLYTFSTDEARYRPELPTTVYGKVVHLNGSPAGGIPVALHWIDSADIPHETSASTLTEQEAILQNNPELAGYYRFAEGKIKAKRYSTIRVEVSNAITEPDPTVTANPGGSAREASQVVIDRSPPAIIIHYPLEDVYYTTDLWMNYTVDEDVQWAVFRLNEQDEVTVTGMAGQRINLSAREGSNTLAVRALDMTGYEGSSQVTFTVVDQVAPTVIVAELDPRIGQSMTLSAAVSDSTNALRSPCQVCIADDGLCDSEWSSAGVVSDFSEGDTAGSCFYQFDSEQVSDGPYAINYRVSDVSGNMGYGVPEEATVDNTPPLPVSNLIVAQVAGRNELQLSWQQSGDAALSGYNIYRSAVQFDLAGDQLKIASVQNTSYLDAGLAEKSIYHYAVTAADDLGNEDRIVASVEGIVPDITPPAIAVLSPEARSYNVTQVQLIFSTNEEVAMCLYSLNQGPNITVSSGQMISVPEGNDNIRMWCSDPAGNFGSSALRQFTVDTSAPAPVTGLVLGMVNENDVALSWTGSFAPDFSHYRVFRAESAFEDVSGMLSIGTTAQTSYTDYAAEESITYYYAVTAVDANGNQNSAVTAKSISTPDSTPPPLTANVTVRPIAGEAALRISWAETAAGDFSEYRVYHDTEPFADVQGMSPVHTIDDRGLLHYVHDGLMPEHTYYYAVTAADTSGNENKMVPAVSGTVADATPPEINITVPDSISTYGNPVPLRISYNEPLKECSLVLNGGEPQGIPLRKTDEVCVKYLGGYDYINNDADPMDDHGHGTHVAATALGNGPLLGVAPDAQLMSYKVLSSGGSGSWSQVIAGIEKAVTDGADIISMSLGGYGGPDDPPAVAVDAATEAGVLSVIAAGNNGPGTATIGTPGAARTALTVGASCMEQQIGEYYCSNDIAYFSSRGPTTAGPKPDVIAPGVRICAAQWDNAWSDSTCYDGDHVAISGTSMATPHVAGAAALLKQAYPEWDPQTLKSAIKSGAVSLGHDVNTQGSGLVDIAASLGSSIIASPSFLDLGVDNKQDSFWQSSDSFTLTNLGDEPRTYTLSPGSLPYGASAQLSQYIITLEPKQSKEVALSVQVNNHLTGDGEYSGSVNVIGEGDAAAIGFSFVKSPVIKLQLSSPARSVAVFTSDGRYVVYFRDVSTDTSILLDEGTYDVLVEFPFSDTRPYEFRWVIRENVHVSTQTVVEVSKADAENYISFYPRDRYGNRFYPIRDVSGIEHRKSHASWSYFGFRFASVRISDFSSKYEYDYFAMGYPMGSYHELRDKRVSLYSGTTIDPDYNSYQPMTYDFQSSEYSLDIYHWQCNVYNLSGCSGWCVISICTTSSSEGQRVYSPHDQMSYGMQKAPDTAYGIGSYTEASRINWDPYKNDYNTDYVSYNASGPYYGYYEYPTGYHFHSIPDSRLAVHSQGSERPGAESTEYLSSLLEVSDPALMINYGVMNDGVAHNCVAAVDSASDTLVASSQGCIDMLRAVQPEFVELTPGEYGLIMENKPGQDVLGQADFEPRRAEASLSLFDVTRIGETNSYIVELESDSVLQFKSKARTSAILSGQMVAEASLESMTAGYLESLKGSHAQISSGISSLGVQVKDHYVNVFNGMRVTGTSAQIDGVSSLPGVKAVYPDKVIRTSLSSSVPYINAPAVWQNTDQYGDTLTGKGVKIAVIDTGVDYTLEEFQSCTPATGFNFSFTAPHGLNEIIVECLDMEDNPGISDPQTFMVDAEPPGMIAALSAVGDKDAFGIQLAWSGSDAADFMQYNLYRSQSPFTEISNASLVFVAGNVTAASYLDQDIADGGVYFYGVTATDFYGNENPLPRMANASAPDATPPYVSLVHPVNMTYTTANLSIEFSASEAVDCAYVLNWQQAVPVSSGDIIPAREGHNYLTLYCNDSSDNTGTAEAAFRVDTLIPGPVTGLRANISQDPDAIVLGWDAAVDDFGSYNVYRSLMPFNVAGNAELTGSVFQMNTPSYADTNSMVLGNTYYYAVTVRDAAGNENQTVNAVGVLFTDITAPRISVSSPDAITYATKEVALVYTANEPVQECAYSVNSGPYTDAASGDLISAGEGSNTITLRCTDHYNNTGFSSPVDFTIDTIAPGTLKNVAVSTIPREAALNISWPAWIHARTYRIYRSDHMFSRISEAVRIAEINDNRSSHKDDGLISEQTYFYAVTAIDEVGNENSSVISVNGTVADTTPPAPVSEVIVESVPGEEKLVVRWQESAVEDFSHYKVYRKSSPAVLVAVIYDKNVTVFVDPNVTQSASYSYAVVVVDDDGNELSDVSFTNATVADLEPPVIAILAPASRVYNMSVISVVFETDEETVDCYYSLNSGPYQLLQQTILAAEGQNSLALQCNDTSGNAGFSNTTYFAVDTAPPQAVSVVTVNTVPAALALNISWLPVADAVYYRLYRARYSFTDVAGLVPIAARTEASYYDAGLESDTLYYYAVVGVDDVGNQDTDVISFAGKVADRTPPAMIAGLAVRPTVGRNVLNLTWTGSPETDFDHYNIYRANVSFSDAGGMVRIGQAAVNAYQDTGLASRSTHFYAVTAADHAGNELTEVVSSMGTVADTDSPAVGIISPQQKTYNQPNIVLDYSVSEPVSGCTYSLNGRPEVPVAGTIIADEGNNSIVVYCTDLGMNVGESGRREFSVDTTPPPPVAGLEVIPVSRQAAISLVWEPSAAADLQFYYIYRSGTEFSDAEGMSPLASVSEPLYGDSGVISEMTYYYAVTAVDEMFNENKAVAALPGTVADLKSPVISIESPAAQVYTANRVSLNVSTDESVSECSYSLNGGLNISFDKSAMITANEGQNQVRVYCYDAAGNLGTDVRVFSVDTQAPPGVKSLAVQPVHGQNSLQLNWDASPVPDLSHYSIYRSSYAFGNVSGAPIASVSQNSHLDSGLVSEATYYYGVTAVDVFGHEEHNLTSVPGTVADTVPPGRIRGLMAVVDGQQTAVKLNWTPPGDDDMGFYRVYRSTESIADVSGLISIASTENTMLIDTTVSDGVLYYYAVTAVDDDGNEDKQVESVSVVTPDASPPVVMVSSVGERVAGEVVLSAILSDAGTGLKKPCQVCLGSQGSNATCQWSAEAVVSEFSDGDENGTCYIIWDTTAVNEGFYSYNFRVADIAENYGEGQERTTQVIDANNTWTFAFDLNSGWNLISVPLMPENAATENALSSIAGNYRRIYYYDSANTNWQVFAPERTVFDQPNNLLQLAIGNSYWIDMTNPATLTVRGVQMINYSAPLKAGWNFIGWPYLANVPVPAALESIGDSYRKIYSYDSDNDQWLVYSRYESIYQPNTLYSLRPGSGYLIDITSETEWRCSAKQNESGDDWCGDGLCNGVESCISCEVDCGTCPSYCGDGECSGDEACSSCEADCGVCPSTCGNGVCDTDETKQSCLEDCHACGDGDCDYPYEDSTCSDCPSGGTIEALIDAPGEQDSVSVSGNRIIWEDTRDEDRDVFLYDLSTGQETQVTDIVSSETALRDSSISGDKIVYRNGATLYIYDIPNKKHKALPFFGYYPQLSGNLIYADTPVGENATCYIHDLDTGETRDIIVPNEYEGLQSLRTFKLDGSRLLYIQPLQTGDPDQIVKLKYYDLETETAHDVSESVLEIEYDVGDGTAVYLEVAAAGAEKVAYRLKYLDLNTGETGTIRDRFLNEDGGFNPHDVRIGQNKATWISHVDTEEYAHDYVINMYDFDAGEERSLVTVPAYEDGIEMFVNYPEYVSGRIVFEYGMWRMYDKETDIYQYVLS